jgi:mannose-6-phosphate isomerase
MSVTLTKIDQVRHVQKPWGYERWLADGEHGFPYVLKEIFIRGPHKSSLQFHEYKKETAWIKSGSGFLHLSSVDVNLHWYQQGGYTAKTLQDLTNTIYTVPLIAGDVFHVLPGQIHRVEAIEDILLIEASSLEVDDVVRLTDDSGRQSGRIRSEHGE